jgi:hypothetical protein
MLTETGALVLTDPALDAEIRNVEPFTRVHEMYRWKAVELLIPDDDGVPQHTAASDVWSLASTISQVSSSGTT